MIAAIVLLVTFFIGKFVGILCANKFGGDGRLAKFLSKANYFAWLSPILGFFTSAASLSLANKSELLQSKLRRNATIGLVASVANFTLAVALLIMMKSS